MMIGYVMFLASDSPMTRYAASFLIAMGAFPFGALCNAQGSANVVSDTARSFAIGLIVMAGNIGGLIATWNFLPFDSPDYKIGNGLNLATSSLTFLSAFVLLLYMQSDNSKRSNKDIDAELAGLDLQQIQDPDWKHPRFKWRP